MTLHRPRARFVETRKLADGTTAFYFCIPKYYRKLGCEIANEPLGTSYEAACGEDGKGGREATLNALFDEWNHQRKTAQAYRGYAKETMRRALAATRKRHAHLLAQRQMEEQSSTEFPNGGWNPFPNASKNLAENKAVSVKKSVP